MGLEVVVKEIREKGQREAETRRKEIREEVTRILSGAQEKGGQIKMAVEEDVQRQISHIQSQEVSAANLIVKREQLNTQKELLDRVYREALEAISKLPEKFHKEAMNELLTQAHKEIPAGIVHCNQRDLPILRQLLANPSFSGFSEGSTLPIEGGIVVESRDSQIKLDLTYRTFLDSVRDDELKEA
ncbi:MAG: V-type ATP synthase subunit E, partial [Methanolinea sp.]|nr:V-type ATP synthase subunit E [Methanolinea sp.]